MKSFNYIVIGFAAIVSLHVNGMLKKSTKKPSYILYSVTPDYTLFIKKPTTQTDKSLRVLITFNTISKDTDNQKVFKLASLNPNNAQWITDFIDFTIECKKFKKKEELEKFKDRVMFDQQSKLLALRLRKKNKTNIPNALHFAFLKELIKNQTLPNPLIIEYLRLPDDQHLTKYKLIL